MIKIKNAKEIEKMRKAGKLAAKLLNYIEPYVKEGVSTLYLNNLCEEYTKKHGAISAPLNYNGFPKSICTSINNVVCHGIPSEKDILKDGNIVNIDVTVILNGFHGDTSRTFLIGNVDEKTKKLVRRTEKAMYRGIDAIKTGEYLYKVGKTIEKYISKFGYSIVRDYGGHGIGKAFQISIAAQTECCTCKLPKQLYQMAEILPGFLPEIPACLCRQGQSCFVY